MIVIPLPEVEGPDGPEEHQQRTRNEDHSSDLEQTRRAGGFHGHGGVGLQSRRGTGRRRRHMHSSPSPVSPGNLENWSGKLWTQHTQTPPPKGPLALDVEVTADSSLGKELSPIDLHPLLSQEVPSTPVRGPVHPATLPTHWAPSFDSITTTPSMAQTSQPRSGPGTRMQPRSLRVPSLNARTRDPGATHRRTAKLNVIRSYQGDRNFVRVLCHV